MVKGAHSTLNFNKSGTKAYDQLEAEKVGIESYRKDFKPLQTGVEHWKTNYQADLGKTATLSKTFNASNMNNMAMRTQSTGKPVNKNLVDETLSKANSYKNRAYINDAKTGVTDYRFNYG